MRLAIVSPYPPSKGTLNEYAYHLVQQLKFKDEIEELIILTDSSVEDYPTEVGSVPVTIDACWSFNSFKNIISIPRALKHHRADVVLFNIQFLSFGDNKIAAALGLLLPVITKKMGIKVITLLHNITETVDLDSAGITSNKWVQKAYQFIGTQLTKLVLQSDILAVTIPKYVEILREKYSAENVALIPHGTFELPPMPNFENGRSDFKVMTFGKFGTYKKVEKMIEAVALVRERTGYDIEIVIAGTDNPNVKGYLKNVEESYSHLPNIRYTGYVAEEDVPTIFEESTVVMFPYTSTTGSSGVLHQAGSYGKAVALPLLGDLKELVEEEGYTGTYFEPENVESMARAIEQLIVDEALCLKVARQNFAAASSLPLDELCDWYLLHFERLLGTVGADRKMEPSNKTYG